MWRLLHPRSREPYAEAPIPSAARRLYYEASDGFSAPLFRLDPSPGASGEPVVIVEGLGLGPDAWRYGRGNLAARLVDAGFAPYLAAVRTSRDATPGPDARVFVEDVVARDLPAALDAAAADSGFPRVHLVAHGLAGVLALAAAARRPQALAGLTVLGGPLTFADGGSAARAAHRLAQLLPRDAAVPVRALVRLGVWIDPDLFGMTADSPGARVRGLARCAVEDVTAPWLRTVARWWRDGRASLYDGVVDVPAALRDADVPLLVVTADGDVVCPQDAGEVALDTWGHDDATAARVPGGHLDLVLAGHAADLVIPWLDARRRRGWSLAA